MMKTKLIINGLCLLFTIGLTAQRKYVGVWEGGSGSNLITKPMDWNAFLDKGEEMRKKGLRLDDLEIFKKGSQERYVGSWRNGTGKNKITKGLPWKDFLKKGENLTKKGYRLWDFETHRKSGKRLYTGNWRSGTGSNIITKGLKWSDFLKKGEDLTEKGFRLADFEVYKSNGANIYVGNWKSGSGSNIITKGLRWKDFLEKGEELTAKGLRLYDVEIIKTGNVKKYVGAWRSGSGSNIITKGLKWSAFLDKGEALTAQGLRLTDFEMFMTPQPQNPNPNPVPDPDPANPDFPTTPDYVKLLDGTIGTDKYRIVVDFTNIIDDKPQITIPTQFLKTLPQYEGEVIFPNNFCGMRVVKSCRFVWLDTHGNVFTDHPYNSVPEQSSIRDFFQQGETFYLGGIDFTGPVGKCENSKENWMFPFPFTQTETVMPEPLKLIIELDDTSEIQFLNFNIKPGKPLDAKKLFKEKDFNKIMKFYKKTFYDGFKQWVDVFCEENPTECPLKEKDDKSK